MQYVALIAGISAVIFALLWRIEVQKRKRFELQKEIAEQTAQTLRELLQLERRLRTAGMVDRESIEKEIRAAEARVAEAEKGTKIDDIFGTASGEEDGQ